MHNNIDLSVLLNLTKEDSLLMKELMEIILNHTPIQLAEINDSIKSSDISRITHAVHKIRSNIENWASADIKKLASALETDARSNAEPHSMTKGFEELNALCQDALSELKTVYANYK